MRISRLFLPAAAFLALALAACGGKSPAPRVVALALDGPPLSLAGDYAGMRLEGEMERTCMAGVGHIALRAAEPEQVFVCEADIDAPPTEKARVRGVFECSGGRHISFMLRNIGPDQGVGIARESREGGLMVFFYHPSAEEARRRLPEALADMAKADASRRTP